MNYELSLIESVGWDTSAVVMFCFIHIVDNIPFLSQLMHCNPGMGVCGAH